MLQHFARTNTSSEGWHNHFQVVVGRHHPSLYAFLMQIKKEQGDTEAMLKQLCLGQKIKKPREPHYQIIEDTIFNIVSNFQAFVDEDDILGYLKTVGYNLIFENFYKHIL